MGKTKRKVAIIGAGVSGMSAAMELISKCTVHLYEATSKLGGRATSLKDSFTNEYIDNGQHICVGAYKHFLSFLSKIDALNSFLAVEKYNIPYFYNGKHYKLQSKLCKGKYGLLESVLRDNNFTFSEKLNTFIFALKLQLGSLKLVEYDNTYELLKSNNQSEKLIKVLWEPLIVSTMNTPVSLASPNIFVKIMRDAFLSKSENAKFLIPNKHFGEIFSNFETLFTNEENQIKFNTPVKAILLEQDKFKIDDTIYDDVIISTPAFVTKRLLSELPIRFDVPDFSPIFSVYFWTNKKLNDNIMSLGADAKFDWIFNREITLNRQADNYSYQLTISDATHFMNRKDSDIMEELELDLRKMYPFDFSIIHSKIVREQMATFLASKKNESKRPEVMTSIKGLYLAGDFPQNGYPSTLEGAAMNGVNAAKHILKYIEV